MNYEYADRMIRDMNRRNLRAFNKLKTMKFDELNVVRRVSSVYAESIAIARRRYLSIAWEALVEAMRLCGKEPVDDDKDILNDWLLDMLEDYDPVTLYQFLPEAERKKQRLIEALIASNMSPAEVDKALRYWTLQIAHYADRSVSDGTIEGYRRAGVKRIRWVTQEDEKVCKECAARNGKIYPIDKIPDRPHYHCRCVFEPVLQRNSNDA